MKTYSIKLIVFIFFGSVAYTRAQVTYTIGPMLHLNIGGKKVKPSFGLEFAYWNFAHMPYSIDFGIDFRKSEFRFYSEMQTGIGIAGVSAGPYIEFKKESKVSVGLQTSVWGNYILGADLRWRITKGQDYFAPGMYAKFLWDGSGWDSGGTGSHSHHHHHHH